MGQEHIETTLKNAVQTGSVSHAYLFCGPRGTGKTTTARLLAKALLCEKAPTDQPDGSCEQCRAIANGLHPDVYELDAASRTGVENVREEIIGRVQFAPTRGTYKIYIVDEVHMLSTAAFNALLKTLEEPPTHVLFVLCTTDPHKIPPTIQSRCQRFDFHRLSEQQIIARLAYIGEQEGYTLEPEALALIAQRSQGGMRDAISSLEQIAVFGSGTVSYAAAESMLGEVSAEQLFSVATIIAQRDVAACFAWVASFTQGGTDIAQFVRDLSGHMRNLYIASVLGNDSTLAEIIEADDEQSVRYQDQAALFGSPDRLAHVLVVLGDLSTQLRSAANARLALEIALTRMARPDSDLSLESLAARVALLEARNSGGRMAIDSSATGVTGASGVTGAAAPAAAPAATSAVSVVDPVSSVAFVESAVVAAESVAPVVSTNAATESVVKLAATEPTEPVEPIEPTEPAASAVVSEAVAASVTLVTPTQSIPSATELNDMAAVEVPAFTPDAARRLWLRVEKELMQGKKHSVAVLLGGSSARPDAKTGGLLVELPGDASFAKQNLERQENRELLTAVVERLHGTTLPLTFILGTVMKRSPSASHNEHAETPELFVTQVADQTAETIKPPPTEVMPSTVTVSQAEPFAKDDAALRDIFATSFGAEVTIQEVNPED
jgi:DNA polymerase-3 subunit gamma/tau